MSGVKDLLGDSNDNEQDQQDTDVTQSKSLIANTYSTEHDDKYKNVSSWEWFDPLGYEVTKEGGTVRTSLKRLSPSGNHEEWYCRFQIKLAHYIGGVIGTLPELDEDEEPEGAAPLMSFLGFDEHDIAEYVVEDGLDIRGIVENVQELSDVSDGSGEEEQSMSDAAYDEEQE